jgi:hypothetical protein
MNTDAEMLPVGTNQPPYGSPVTKQSENPVNTGTNSTQQRQQPKKKTRFIVISLLFYKTRPTIDY